jgi:hypothetical protein
VPDQPQLSDSPHQDSPHEERSPEYPPNQDRSPQPYVDISPQLYVDISPQLLSQQNSPQITVIENLPENISPPLQNEPLSPKTIKMRENIFSLYNIHML